MDRTVSDIEYLLDQKKYRYSIYILTGFLNQDADCLKALILRCKCYFYLAHYEKSIEDGQKIISIDKCCESAYIYLAKCYTELTELSSAEQVLQDLLKIDPKNRYANYALEKLKTLTYNFKKAVEAKCNYNYKGAIEYIDICLESQVSQTRFNLFKVECLIYLQDYNNAKQILEHILKHNDKNPKARLLDALITLYQERSYKQGLVKLQAILDVSQEAQETYNKYQTIKANVTKGQEMIQYNNYVEAKVYYEKALSLIDIQDSIRIQDVHKTLSKINFRLSLYEESIINCCTVLEINPDDLQMVKQRAISNNELKDYENALEDMNIVIQVHNTKYNRDFIKSLEEKLKCEELDSYKILGVPKNSTEASVKNAYRNLALLYHPDKHQNKHIYFVRKYEKLFCKVQKAYCNLVK